MRAAWIAVFAVSIGVAQADEPDLVTRPKILPTLTVKGSEKGDGTISLGLDFLIKARNDASISLKPTLDVQSSDGVGTLLAVTADGSPRNASWLAGLDVTFRRERVLPTFNARETPAEKASYRKAFLACLIEDSIDPTFARAVEDAVDPDKPVLGQLDTAIINLDFGKLCPKGKDLVLGKEANAVRPLPTRQISVGIRGGLTTMKYLEPGALPDTLVKDASDDWAARFGVNVIDYSPGEHFTVEAGVTFDSKTVAAKDKVKWCVPQDPVEPTPDVPGDPTGSAQVCDERPGEPPTRHYSMRGELGLGYVSKDALARGMLGLSLEIDNTSLDWPQTYKLGVIAPIYLQYSDKNYSGIVRVVPRVAWSNGEEDDEDGWEVGMTIALLGKRNLFPSALD